MGQWQTAQAKQQFSKLVATATTSGPQVVMRHSEPVVVVMSADDYRVMARQANLNLANLLISCPLDEGDIGEMSMKLGDAGLLDDEVDDAA